MRRVLTLAALIAVAIQTLVVQTHIDGLGGLQSRASIERSLDHQQASNPNHDPLPCPLCEALATAGVTVLASGPTLLTSAAIAANEALVAIRHVPVRAGHAWQSRAPPISL